MTKSKPYVFREYDHAEAEAAGRAFLEAFKKNATRLIDCHAAPEWTEVVLDWFAASADPTRDVVVDASPAKRLVSKYYPTKEFGNGLDNIAAPSPARQGASLLDLAHHRLRAYSHYRDRAEYWRRAYARDQARPPEMLLGLETEAGKRGNESWNTHLVMEDASKLLPSPHG